MIPEEAFMDIISLHRQGHSMRFIARKLGLHRNTVKKYILGRRFPEYRRTERRVSILAPFVRMIQDWLSQDNYRASWIFERLKRSAIPAATRRSRASFGRSNSSRPGSRTSASRPCLGCKPRWTGLTSRSPNPAAQPHGLPVLPGPGLLPGDLCRARQPLHAGELSGRPHPCVSLPRRGACRAALRQHEACGHPA